VEKSFRSASPVSSPERECRAASSVALDDGGRALQQTGVQVGRVAALDGDDFLDSGAGVLPVAGAGDRERIALDDDADQINDGELLAHVDPLGVGAADPGSRPQVRMIRRETYADDFDPENARGDGVRRFVACVQPEKGAGDSGVSDGFSFDSFAPENAPAASSTPSRPSPSPRAIPASARP
jgi:hypothetical protein